MFFSSKPRLLIYLRRDGFEIYGKSQAKFVFPEGLVQNLEVENGNLLHDQVSQFLSHQDVNKTNAICLLDDSVLFQKIVPANATTNVTQIKQDFASSIPFEIGQVGVVSLLTRDQLILIAANKAFYTPIVVAFADYGCKVSSIAPAAVFGRGQITQASVDNILANSKNAEKANFLSS